LGSARLFLGGSPSKFRGTLTLAPSIPSTVGPFLVAAGLIGGTIVLAARSGGTAVLRTVLFTLLIGAMLLQ